MHGSIKLSAASIGLSLLLILSSLPDAGAADGNADDLRKKASEMFRKGEYSLSLDLLNKAIEINPQNWLYFNNRAASRNSLGLFDAALKDTSEAIRLAPSAGSAHQERAYALRHLGRLDEALAEYNKAESLGKYIGDGRARVFLAQEDHLKAIEECDRQIKRQPDDAMLHYLKGIAYEHMGDYERSLADAGKALALSPEHAQALALKSRVLVSTRRFEEAAEECTRLIKMNPREASAFLRRAYCLDRSGNKEGAANDFARYAELAGSGANALKERGQIYTNLGRYEEAIADFTRAIKLAPQDAELFRRRSRAYRKLKDAPRARADIDACLKLKPGWIAALRAQAILDLVLGNLDGALVRLEALLPQETARQQQAMDKYLLHLGYQKKGMTAKSTSLLAEAKSIPELSLARNDVEGIAAEMALDQAPAAAQEVAYQDGRSATGSSPETVRDKWALVIGISRFKNPQYNLKFSAKDAQDFARYLTTEANFKSDHVLVLLNEQATHEAILSAFGSRWLPNVVEPGDLVVIYVSTHGTPSTADSGGKNYIVAWDTDVNNLYPTAVDMDQISQRIATSVHTNRVVLILDTCYSGAGSKGSRDLLRYDNFDVAGFKLGRGHIVLSSSGPQQRSWEGKHYQNGVFTFNLLSALRQNSDITRAFKELAEGVRWEVKRDYGVMQEPKLSGQWTGGDLYLAAPASKPRRAAPVDLGVHAPEPAANAHPTSSGKTLRIEGTSTRRNKRLPHR